MNKEKTIHIAFILLVLLFLLRFLGYAMPSARLWGVNHLIFLPPWVTVVYAVAGIIILAGYYANSGRKIGEAVVERFDNLFFEGGQRVFNRVILIILGGVVFAFFAMPTHFLGDGYMQINNLGSSHYIIHKWSERGMTYIASIVQSFLGERSVANARTAFQIVSVVSGMVSLFFMLLLPRELGEDKYKRLLALAALTCSGVMLLFFGYAESYPLLWVGLTGFFYFGIKYANSGRGIWWALLLFIFGVFIHVYMLVFIPALIGLALSREKGRRFYNKFKTLFWAAMLFVAVAGAVGLYIKIQNNLAVENMFLRPFAGKPVDEGYYIFSAAHMLDIVNISLVLSPLLIVIIYMAGSGWKRVYDISGGVFMALSAVGSFMFLLVIDPQLAMPRDWDLFSPSFLALTMLSVMLVSSHRLKAMSGRIVAVALMSVLMVAPYIIANLNEESSVRYHKYIIDLDRKKSVSSFIILRTYYQDGGNERAADSLNNLYPLFYPDAARLRMALDAVRAGDGTAAEKYLVSVKPNKFNAAYHNVLGGLYYLRGELELALKESAMALQLEPFKSSTHRERVMMFTALKMYDSVMVWLKSGYQLDDADPFILGGLSWLHYRQQNYDSTIFYASRMAALGPDGVGGNYWLAKVAALRSNRTDFSRYFDIYQKRGEADLAFETRLEELRKLADSLGIAIGR